jgi:hypothetical protein
MRYLFPRLLWAAAVAAVWSWSPLCFTEAAELRVATFRCDVTPLFRQKVAEGAGTDPARTFSGNRQKCLKPRKLPSETAFSGEA